MDPAGTTTRLVVEDQRYLKRQDAYKVVRNNGFLPKLLFHAVGHQNYFYAIQQSSICRFEGELRTCWPMLRCERANRTK